MIITNILSIFVYLIVTTAAFKPAYVGVTIALLTPVFEMSFIMVWKYRATNYEMQASVVVPMLAGVGTMLVWVVYIVFAVVLEEDEPNYIKGSAIGVCAAYFLLIIATLLWLEYRSAGSDASKLTLSFWILFIVAWVILIGIGAAAVNFTAYGLFGIVWMTVCIYVLLNILLYRYRKVIGALFGICFVAAGTGLLWTSDDYEQSFQGISVLYFGMFILSFGAFCREYIRNKLQRRRSIFMNAPAVMPMLQYNLETRQMQNRNAEPMLFFFFIYVLLLWAFSSTIIVKQEWRYIPLQIISLSLAFAFIYIIEKNVDATTIDRKFFKQATSLFYTSCLATATDYKKKWRNADRAIKHVASDADRKSLERL